VALLDVIRSSWGWTGIDPAQVVGDNDFGNLMIKDSAGCYWRLCPEDLYCRIVAKSREELDRLSHDQAFLRDWYMTELVNRARERVGPLRPGFKYCLKIPGVLGGKYEPGNLASVALQELVAASGSIAQQIDGLPDGAKIKLSVVD
jgi:hypothetical protein